MRLPRPRYESQNRKRRECEAPTDLSHSAGLALTGEADDGAISHLAERTTDSYALAGRRTKHPPEKRRTCPHVRLSHTETEQHNLSC